MKDALYSELARGAVDIRTASRRMRKSIGMTQVEYAKIDNVHVIPASKFLMGLV